MLCVLRIPSGLRDELRSRSHAYLALDDESPLHEERTNALAEISLQLDASVRDGAPGAACALEVLTEVLQKRGVAGQAVHHGDGLPAASFLPDAQLGDNPSRNRLVTTACATAAVVRGPAALRAHSSGIGGIDNSPAPAVPHGAIMRESDGCHKRTCCAPNSSPGDDGAMTPPTPEALLF